MKVTGVLHMHSTHSYDGKLSLSELKSKLIDVGVSFCCMTEHTDEMTPEAAARFVYECKTLSDPDFIFVPGFEVPYKDTHLLHIGATDFVCQKADISLLQKWRKVTPLVILAHPVRNHFRVDNDLRSIIDGVEIWNQQYEGKRAPRFRSLKLYFNIKKLRSGLLATSGLDLHREDHLGTPKLELEIETLSVEAIVKSLHHGEYVSVSKDTVIDARGRFLKGGGVMTRWQSFVSILLISFGKFVNRSLSAVGFKLPNSLRQKIRQRV